MQINTNQSIKIKKDGFCPREYLIQEKFITQYKSFKRKRLTRLSVWSSSGFFDNCCESESLPLDIFTLFDSNWLDTRPLHDRGRSSSTKNKKADIK